MLQRIQSVYLLIASICMLLAIVMPLAFFQANGDEVLLNASGVYLNEEIIFPTWGLMIIGAISSVLSLFVIFIYKKRMLQIRLVAINIFIMLGFYGFVAFIIFMKNPEFNATFSKLGYGLVTPIIAIIVSYLAIRKIGEDEALIRSLNRIR